MTIAAFTHNSNSHSSMTVESSPTSSMVSPQSKALPHKRASLSCRYSFKEQQLAAHSHPHSPHSQQQSHASQQFRSSINTTPYTSSSSSSLDETMGLMSYEGAMSLRWQMLASHRRQQMQQQHQQQQHYHTDQQHEQQQQPRYRHQQMQEQMQQQHYHNRSSLFRFPAQEQQQYYDQQQQQQHYAQQKQQQQRENGRFRYDLAMALQTTSSFVTHMPLERSTGSGISIVSSDHSNSGSSPMDISLSSLSSHSSSSYHHIVSCTPKKTVRFAEQNSVWLRSMNDDDLRAAWYTDDDYKAFEADNRHIVSTLLQQRKERETSNAANANGKPPSIPLLDDCVVKHDADADTNDHDCICGLEHYMEGRKPMMKRKLCILQHSAMVLEMFEEQRRTTTTNSTTSTANNTNATTVALSTAASVLDGTSNHSGHSHGSHNRTKTASTDRLWLDPELVRKVSLRFSKEPTQRALNRAAQMAASL